MIDFAPQDHRPDQSHPDLSQPKVKYGDQPLQEMLFVAEAAAKGGMKAVPGKEWALHYPQNGAERNDRVQGLLDGRYQPTDSAEALRPDAIVYDIKDLEILGVETVSARISEACLYQQQFDYHRFVEFISSMKGKNIPLDTLQKTYDGVVSARVQKRVHEAFSRSGQSQIEKALQAEVEETNNRWSQLSPTERVLACLKQHWLAEDLKIIDPRARDLTAQLLSPEEKILFDQMKESYRKYLQQGDEISYQEMVKQITDQFPNMIPHPNQDGEMSQEMQDLAEELEVFEDQVGPPGSNRDSGIPPEDQDEYHTPPPQVGGKEGAGGSTVFYEITPPMSGYYIKGRKSYYDVDQKVWSKKKQLTRYDTHLIAGSDRHTISGFLDTTLKAIPLPKTYAIDCNSLKVNGAQISFFRDQNGCFYLQASSPCKFEVDFLKEPQTFPELTRPEDLAPMYRGSLASDTENTLRLLQGTNTQKAKQVQSYILTHHFYPGGGDLNAAQALQYKLRSQSTGDNYIQNLDQSKYLECYSANTLFCAMLRKVGVPTRLVVGDRVQGARNGKSEINSSTGHAWSEIWDGQQWVRFDATPAPKPEDKKKDQKQPDQQDQGQQQSAPEADDGAADQTPPPQQGSQDQQPGQQGQQAEPSGESSSQQQMPEASDEAVQEGQKQLEEAAEQLHRMEEKLQELQKKISEAKTFEDLEKIKNEIDAADLVDKMEDSLEEKVEAKEEQLKEEMADTLDQMTDDGFMDEEKRQELIDQMKDADPAELEKIKKQIELERKLFDEYDALKEQVEPYVEKWWKYFADRLPKEQEVDNDEDALTRSGAFNRRSVQRFRNLMYGTVKNPRKIVDSTKPRFIAKVLIDTSTSMRGDKLHQATLLLVFYNELFSRISKKYGYIRYSNDTFSDGITEIKGFDQDYNSPRRYDFKDGSSSTIKARLMQMIKASGGTNILDAVKKAGDDLNKEVSDFPDFASALYFIGDGEDSLGNASRIKQFLSAHESESGGFGRHMISAIMLGNESQRQVLAQLFGDESTRVASDFETLIEQSMLKLEEDITGYLEELE